MDSCEFMQKAKLIAFSHNHIDVAELILLGKERNGHQIVITKYPNE